MPRLSAMVTSENAYWTPLPTINNLPVRYRLVTRSAYQVGRGFRISNIATIQAIDLAINGTVLAFINMLRTHWIRLPTNQGSITLLSLDTFLLALTYAVTERLAPTLHPLELHLFRCVVTLLVLTPAFMFIKGRSVN